MTQLFADFWSIAKIWYEFNLQDNYKHTLCRRKLVRQSFPPSAKLQWSTVYNFTNSLVHCRYALRSSSQCTHKTVDKTRTIPSPPVIIFHLVPRRCCTCSDRYVSIPKAVSCMNRRIEDYHPATAYWSSRGAAHTDLDFCLRRENVGHDIFEEHLPSVREHDSGGRCWRPHGAQGYNHGVSMQSRISATGNMTAIFYRGACPQSFPVIDTRHCRHA